MSRSWGRRLLVVYVGWGLVGWVGWPAGAWAEELSSAGGSLSLSGRPLSVEGMQALTGGSEESATSSPEAVRLNSESEVAYEGVSSSESEGLAGRVFPGVIGEPAGGPPPLRAGQTFERFPTDNAMAVLDEGRRTIIESLQQIAVVQGPGRVPIDLSLGEAGGRYAPKTPAAEAHLSLPRHLSEGLELLDLGIGLVPVDEYGAPLEAQGTIDGATIFYADSEGAGVQDLSTLAKPTTGGMDLISVLSSKRSPERLYFKVVLREGASLSQEGSGPVQVMDAGRSIAQIAAPAGRDADGRFVPLTLGVSGDVVTVTVARAPGEYEYPIEADPYMNVKDEQLNGGYGIPTNWHFCTSVSSHCYPEELPFRSRGWGWGTPELISEAAGEYFGGAFAEFIYKTQGESKIFEATTTTEATENEGESIESSIQIVNENGTVNSSHLFSVSNYGSVAYQLPSCTAGCPPLEYHNSLRYMQAATGWGHHFHNRMSSASVRIEQEVSPTATPDTTDQYLLGGKWLNVLYGNGAWMSEHQGALGFTAEDKGIGVSNVKLIYGEPWFEENLLAKAKCSGVQCPESFKQEFTYNKKMLDGEHSVYFTAENAAGGYGYSSYVNLKVDTVSPTGLQVTGLPASGMVSMPVHLKAQATDGSGTTRSSGIKSLELGVDGYNLLGGKSGSCEQGPCTASGEWTLNGEEFGAGKHELELVATDNAGNKETRSYEFTVRHAGPISVGPASVDPMTGTATLQASDVSIGGGYGALGVSRSFNSRQLTAGEEGPLGPQWSISLSGEQGLESESTGAVTLVAEDGSRVTFASDGKGGFISPKGDENIVLSAEREGATVKAYLLTDPAKGTTVKFIHPSGASEGDLWVIEKAEGALSKENGEKQTYKWEAVEGIERPKQALAPAPSGVSCEPELKTGCRALSFAYATETKASGEAPSEWGEYKGRLSKVSFTAYDPVSKAMKTTAVAEYVYDNHGRLRAEWDPRISPTLKSTYGYDSEGRVVAVNPPGQEPWLLHYGMLSGDTAPGRLLSAIRPPASAKLESNLSPSNESKPALSSTTPVVGTTLSVSSNGSWSNTPLAYTYQWQDCDSKGENCVAIQGAVNESYTPQERDAGYTLQATVTAINADGSGSASTDHSSAIAGSAPGYALKFGSSGEGAGQLKNPAGGAIDGEGKVWVADHNNNRIDEFSSSGTFVKTVGWGVANGEAKLQTCTSSCRAGLAGSGNGELSAPDGLVIVGQNIYVADAGNNRIEELTTAGAFVRGFGSSGSEPGQMKIPVAVAIDRMGNVWVADRANNRIDQFTEAGSFIGSFGSVGTGNGQFKEPSGIAFSGEYAYVVDAGNSRVQQLTLSGAYVAQFGSAGSGNGQFSKPAEIATEPVSGDLYVADNANNRIEEFNPAGTFLASVGSAGEGEGQFKGVEGIAVNASGGLYAADLGNSRVQELTPTYSTNNPVPAPPSVGTSAVTTVEYQVPVSGTGAPYPLGSSEVAKWAQSDDPVEASAIFPPDEPMGWPAQDYKRAAISYYDASGRTVNTVSPSGAISTGEYNETNDIIRTLSPSSRAAALKEGAKSAEVSKLLDVQNTYNAEGAELVETLGPQHMVKLSNGEEKLARKHVHNYYDEEAPAGKTYGLVTKSVVTAQVGLGQYDEHKTTTSYSGQEGLGWLLRQPTSVTVDPRGAKLVTRTVYDRHSGSVIETKGPDSDRAVPAAVYSSQIGTLGTGNGQFKNVSSVAGDSKGDIWVTDKGNNRVQEFSPTGEYVRQFGTEGTANGQFKSPAGIAIDSKDNLWVVDSGNYRVQEFSSTGEYIRQFGSHGPAHGQFEAPGDIAIDPKGNVWVVDALGNRVDEFSSTGEYLRQFGSSGSGNGQFTFPAGIAVDYKGNLWVVDLGHSRVEEFSNTGEYLRQFGSEGTGGGQFKGPEGITIEEGDNIWVADSANNRVQEFTLTGEYIGQFGAEGTGSGQLKKPHGLGFDSKDNLWVADTSNNRVQKLAPNPSQPAFSSQFGAEGASNGQFKEPYAIASDPESNVWVADTKNNRVQEFTTTEYLRQFGSFGTGNGQFSEPRGIATDPKGNVWVADKGNNRVEEFSNTGGYLRQFGTVGAGNGQLKAPFGVAVDASENIWMVDTGNNRVEEFSNTGGYLRQFGTVGAGNGQFKEPSYIAVDVKGNIWVTDTGNNRVEEFTGTGEYLRQFGTEGTASGQFKAPSGIVTDTKGDAWVVDTNNSRVQEFSAGGEYLGQFGSLGANPGQFVKPRGIAIDPSGNFWVMDSLITARADEWVRFKSPHESQMIYYTPSMNTRDATCGNHPEWVNLPCRSRPTVQPTTGNPLPVVTDTYNMWDEPEAVTEAFGSTTRTKKSVYDTAGRLTGSEVTSTLGTALPKVTNEYDSKTGAMVKQSTTVGEKTQTITSVYNTLGQLTEYTDADSNKSTYVYDVDGRVSETSDGKGARTYAYDPTTGALAKLFDVTASMTFTASYDLEGRMTSESYPNGMSAKYAYDEAGEVTHSEYVKEAHCAGACPEVWFSESVSYSIHGEALSRSSTLASEAYTYDNAGRLTQVQETPAGKGCTTRLYAYDEESNRLSLTTREPGAEGKCATSGGTVENHVYDEADRLSDTGTTYDAFGNTTALSAADAEGHEIKSSYYVSSQTRSTAQNGKTITYNLDPDARSREILTEEGASKTSVINHYPGPGGSIAWSDEGTGKYTRNIPGIDGALSAVEKSGGTPVLQLHDLQGNIIATAALSETETKVLSTYNSTEFGVPVNGTPPTKYSWLGASGVSPEFASGATASGGAGYVPQLGRPLQTQAIVPPGAAPDGAYISPYISTISAADWQASASYAAEAPMREAGRVKKAEEEACEKAPLSCSQEEDPIEHYRAWEANKYAAELREKVKESGLVDFLGGLFNLAMGPEAALEGFFGRNKIEEWSLAYAGYLEGCTVELHRAKRSHGGCRAAVYDITFLIWDTTVINFNRFPTVSWCEGMSSDRREVHWCYVIADTTIHGNGSPF
jgi:YD repeat-containing protein